MQSPRAPAPISGRHLKPIQHLGKQATYGHWRCEQRGGEKVGNKAEKTKRTWACCELTQVYQRPLGSSHRDTAVLSNSNNTLKGEGGPEGNIAWPQNNSSVFVLWPSLC